MTVREALTRTLDNPAEFPRGWETDVKDVFRKVGREFYERRQKKVWVVKIVSGYSEEPPKTLVCRSRANAVELMERDICETLASENPHFDPADLVRLNDNEATLGDEIAWTIEKTELRD